MTSSAYVRNSLLRCIELGRNYKQTGNQAEKFESLRILGQALHTLEDFSAHSNFCELVLVQLGYRDVFCQVGTATSIRLNNQNVFPLTTGTFGGLDFVHSLLGEATDKISQTQINEVSAGLASSSSQNSLGLLSNLQSLVTKIPGASSLNRDVEEMQAVSAEADAMRSRAQTGSRDRGFGDLSASANTNADEIARKIYPIMAFRDRLMKGLSAFFEKIPGLNALIDRISEALTVWVLSTIEPFMKPVVEKITGALGAGQALVTSGDAQLEVFENAHSSDPTHSMLAKDHFTCYLNQPAGLIAQAVVKHVVARVTVAWADTSVDPHSLIEEILEVFHHPANAKGHTSIQSEMQSVVQRWVEQLGSKKTKILSGLSMDGVKNGLHHEGGSAATTGVSTNHSHQHGPTSTGLGRQTQQASHQLYTTHDTGAVPGGHGTSHRVDHHAATSTHHGKHGNTQSNYGGRDDAVTSSSNDGYAKPSYQSHESFNSVHPSTNDYSSNQQSHQPPHYTQGTHGGHLPQSGAQQPYSQHGSQQQGAPYQDYAAQDSSIQQGYSTQAYQQESFQQQGYPPQAYPPQGYPPQGYPPQGYPPQGYPPQGYPPQGYPPQGYPAQGYPPQGYPAQGYPPQGYPAQDNSRHQAYGDSSDWTRPQR